MDEKSSLTIEEAESISGQVNDAFSEHSSSEERHSPGRRRQQRLRRRKEVEEDIEMITTERVEKEEQDSRDGEEEEVEDDSQEPESLRRLPKVRFKAPVKLKKLTRRLRREPKKKTDIEERGELNEEQPAKSDEESDGSDKILTIKLHQALGLPSKPDLRHPVVKVHVVDLNTGRYLKKSGEKNVTSYYEREELQLITPVMSQPSSERRARDAFRWQEEIVFNDHYKHFIRPEIVFLFEILDFETLNNSSPTTIKNWWRRIAWAFLRPVSVGGQVHHVGHSVRLQLYKPKNQNIARNDNFTTELYDWFRQKSKTSINGLLMVTVDSASRSVYQPKPALRSKTPLQAEESMRRVDAAIFESIDKDEESTGEAPLNNQNNNQNHLLWNRIEGQPCKLAKSEWQTLTLASRGCFSMKFSPDGRKLAAVGPVSSAENFDRYEVFIYEIPSFELSVRLGQHSGIVYDVDWSPDGKKLVTASNDCTARIWTPENGLSKRCQFLPHPCFLYASKFSQTNKSLVVTGGFDGFVRIWLIKDSTDEPLLVQELFSHRGPVLCLGWDLRTEQLFSGGQDGTVKIHERKSDKQGWVTVGKVELKELKNVPINNLVVLSTGSKMVIFCRDGVHRLVDYKLELVVQQFQGSLNFRNFFRGCLTPCENMVFAGSEDGSVIVWKTDTGERLYTYFGMKFSGPPTTVEYHPHDHIFAICGLGSVGVFIYRHKFESFRTKLEPINYRRSKKDDKDWKRNADYIINMLDEIIV